MASEYFEMQKSQDGDVVRFFVKGRISSTTSFKFGRELNAALSMGQNNMILDMSEVEFLSSLGIRSILSAYKQTAATGGKLQIANPTENVVNVLGMAALSSMLLEE